MNHDYADIRGKIPEPPQWFDEHAVPRYCEFKPNETANLYADKCVLLLIECQDCGHEFKVCFTQTRLGLFAADGQKVYVLPEVSPNDLASLVRHDKLHYGDPPNIGCCAAGPTVNSVPVRVLEFWDRMGEGREWERVPELEVEVSPPWAANVGWDT